MASDNSGSKKKVKTRGKASLSVDKLTNGMNSAKVFDVEKIDKEELRSYMFPCVPIEPWLEQILTNEFDDSTTYDPKSKLFHVNFVSSQLSKSIFHECYSGTGKYQSKCDIQTGNHVDAKSLLFPSGKGYLVRRNRKVRAKDLNLGGKYVMLCCFMVPLCWNDHTARAVAVACHDLYSKMKNQFEMVIVAIMRDGWTHDRKAYRQFMSAFPPSCLAIPFHAKSHCRRVCKYLGGMLMTKITLVDPAGKVLLHDEALLPTDTDFVPWYPLANSHPFPFVTDADVDADAGLHLTVQSSLEDLLYCRTSDFVLRKNPQAFSKEKLPIFQLKEKLVGLYLYKSGHLLPWLCEIEEMCRQTNKELEIVVVYLPNWHGDPRCSTELFCTVLAKQNISWWVAPYNNTTSIILKHLFEGEKVIIVGPNGSYVDTYGAELMQIYGITAYPFTVKHIVQKTVSELSKVSLDSFLELLNMRLEHHHIGKNILFYFDHPFHVDSVLYEAYTRFASDMDAVILPCSIAYDTGIATTEPKTDDSKQVSGKLSWHHTCIAGNNVVDKFFERFFNVQFRTIVAFGKDGRICSLLAHRLPYSHGDKSFPVKGDLFEEVLYLLDNYLAKYDLDELRYSSGIEFKELQELRQSWV